MAAGNRYVLSRDDLRSERSSTEVSLLCDESNECWRSGPLFRSVRAAPRRCMHQLLTASHNFSQDETTKECSHRRSETLPRTVNGCVGGQQLKRRYLSGEGSRPLLLV